MCKKHTYQQIASDLALWKEYFDVDATMSDLEFNALSIDKKIAMQIEAFGEEIKEDKNEFT